MRVVIDTNVIVSSALSSMGAPARIVQHGLEGTFQLVVSETILAEYRRALGYERARKRHGHTPDRIADIRKAATLVAGTLTLKVISEDPDDDKFLECAVEGGAEYIVSGDAHLLNLQHYQGIQILTPAVFDALLNQQPTDRG
jgi:putative PIN family toxin of toxin-antitoxin system